MTKHNIYPSSSTLENHYSIFSIAFRHSVTIKNIEPWKKTISKIGWRPHDFLRGSGPRSGIKNESKDGIIPFIPHSIFTPTAQEMTFGFRGTSSEKLTDDEIIDKRLMSSQGNNKTNRKQRVNNLLLNLPPSKGNQIQQPLTIKTNIGKISFQIEWADTWLFNDKTGLLSFKVRLVKGDETQSSLDELNTLNRVLRDLTDSKVCLDINDDSTSQLSFWNELVFQRWFGVNSINSINLLGSMANLDVFKKEHIDEYTRYAKLLTMAQVPDLDGGNSESNGKRDKVEYLWNAPVTDPPIDFEPYYEQITKGERTDISSAYHFATMEGYPTLGDYMLYDLSTCGFEGASAGLIDNRGWQASPEYLRTLLGEHGIEIWEYWRGMALHDTLAFLAYDKTMPISWQAEAYYYPLYAYLYHIQFRLNCYSKEIIDQELTDVLKARRIKDSFNKFRNQYWFHNVTVEFQGIEIANKLKAGLGIDEHYDTVQAEIEEISDFIDDKIDKGKQSLIAFVILAIYPITYIFDTLGITDELNAFSDNNPILAITITLVLLVFLAIISIKFMPRITELMLRLADWFYKNRQ